MARSDPEHRRGHRVVSHTADVILEAWGPDLALCCEEAVDALTATFLDARRAEVLERRSVHLRPGPADALLLQVLDEVIFLLDTESFVPVGASVDLAGDGGLDVTLLLADRDTVCATGAVPKAISRSELHVERGAHGVHCRFLVDV